MLVLSMNSKRYRRPNVRLGDIGDGSAASASRSSKRAKAKLGHKRWKHQSANFGETESNLITGYSQQKSSELGVLVSGVRPVTSADTQQNRENEDPNSSKLGFEVVSSDEYDAGKSKLNFKTITREAQLMNRRSRTRRFRRRVFGGAWTSEPLSQEISSEDVNEYGAKEYDGFASNTFDPVPVSGFEDFSGHDTPATSREASENEMDGPTLDARAPWEMNELWKDDACFGSHIAYPKSGGSVVYNVSRWLEELGFGKFVGLFELHGVDEETLPLLTFEDLREMGLLAIGTRRKLYTEIKKLRDE